MGILKGAFNALLSIHSRQATIKRMGNPILYSPCKISPSNYFRFLDGPSDTVIRGREFIIPLESLFGTAEQLVSFDQAPTDGTWKLTYGTTDTSDFNFDDTAAEVQTALRLITGLADCTVTGDYTTGFLISYMGVQTPLALDAAGDGVDFDAVITVGLVTYEAWDTALKRGDKIIDSLLGHMAIDEIVEMPDLGGGTMAFRVRCE
jgi:hypothetical protein